MTFSHEDANARLLDLVYGEAPPAEREALQAHVSGCARCQAELETLGDTRARVRVALDDQAPPARVHASILAAAAEAVNGAQSGAAATAAPAKGNEPPSRAARNEEQPSFWERLRSKWTLPTLATIGTLAVAMFVLGPKVFMDPQKTAERGRQGLYPEKQASAPANTESLAAAEPPPPSAAPAAPAEEQAKPAEVVRAHDRELSPQMRARIQAVRAYNQPRNTVGGLMGSPPYKADRIGADKIAGAPASQAISGLRPDSFGSGSGRGGGAVAAAPAAPAEKKPAKGSLDDLLDSSAKPSYASPPAGWKGAGPAAGEAAAPSASRGAARAPKAEPETVAKKKTVNDNPLDGLFGSGGGSARAKSAPERAESAAEESAEAESSLGKRRSAPPPPPAAKPAPVAPAAPPVVAQSGVVGRAAEPPADAKKEKDGPAPYETLAKRADALFDAKSWAEAATIYNELLRRYPTAELAARWRSRAVVAQREAAPRHRPASKASSSKAAAPPPSRSTKSSDALEGFQ